MIALLNQRGPTQTDAYHIIKRHLRPQEHLLWVGRPKDGIRWRSSILLLFVVCFAFVVFLITISVKSILASPPDYSGIGISLAIGSIISFVFLLILLSGPIERSQLFYAITNNHIIVVHGAKTQKVTRFHVCHLESPRMVRRRDGSGTLMIFTHRPLFRAPGNRPQSKHRSLLRMVGDADVVLRKLADARSSICDNPESDKSSWQWGSRFVNTAPPSSASDHSLLD